VRYNIAMKTHLEERPRVAVVGGGITGLAAAHRLTELQPNWKISLYEAGERLGGVLQTSPRDGFLIEAAADNFIRGPSAPWAEKLCERIGFADQLIGTNPQFRQAHIFWNGRLLPVPEGFQLMAPSRLTTILVSPLLSPMGKLRLMLEPLVPIRRDGGDESLADFATRRLGREAFERLVQPLVSGIYTADPAQLSVQSALPQMVEMEREYGSLYKAMRVRMKQRKQPAAVDRNGGARYSLFVAPRNGMSSLVAALRDRLTGVEIRLATPVTRLRRDAEHGWQLSDLHAEQDRDYDGVILALPTPAAANLVRPTSEPLAEQLASIPHASSVVVCLGYRERQLSRPLEAFGCVVPSVQGKRVLAISYSSQKYAGRAPEGCQLFRVFVGGALQHDLTSLPDDEVLQLAREEVADILGVQGEPILGHVARWEETMPQFHVGHGKRLEQIRQHLQTLPRLYLAGNGYEGVGLPQCIRSGESAAEALVAELAD
jgi:oxygen-dependent protoporphyrinogen oxidase